MSQRIEDLEAVTLGLCQRFLTVTLAQSLNLKLTQTLRTMDEQARLYAQGRDLPGRIVTYAKPGQSPHNWGMAFDVAFMGSRPYPSADDPVWEKLGELGEGLGLTWGGRWKLRDLDHFERTGWKALTKGLAP